MNSIEKLLSDLSLFLKNNNSDTTNKILNSFGVSKEELLKKLNNTSNDEIMSKLNDKKLLEKINSLSQDDLKSLNQMAQNKDTVQEIYKNLIDSKEGK
jgi:Mg/Co/Ni transporter MgtE